MTVRALVLTGDGINCEEETAFALREAGAEADICHINSLIADPARLQNYRILALPGGFSFGDEVGSGKILALKLRHALGDLLRDYVAGDNLVIGICNGFQALVKLGLLPGNDGDDAFTQRVTLTHNRQGRFMNRWVALDGNPESLFFKGLGRIELPIRHGEGRLLLAPGDEAAITPLLDAQTALRYCEDVNGSFRQIAGLTNAKGNVLGLMPHPEAFIRWTQHPAWTSMSHEEMADEPAGRRIFENMIHALST